METKDSLGGFCPEPQHEAAFDALERIANAKATEQESEDQVCISRDLAERVHAALVAHESEADEWAGMAGDSRGSGPADYSIEMGELVDEFAKSMEEKSVGQGEGER